MIDNRSGREPAADYPDYNTISTTKKVTGLSEHYLRKLLKEGQLPGFYVGTRYMVNLRELRLLLQSKESAGSSINPGGGSGEKE